MFLLVEGEVRLPAVLGREVESEGPISLTPRRASKISSSVNRPKGSRLLRMVPVKSVGSEASVSANLSQL